MKEDLGLSETQYGILSGVTYTLITAFSGLFMGYIADRVNRKWALFMFSFLWSGATLASSFATDFTTILLPRIFTEICLAACFPLCFSLISDSFPPKFRARASSIYTLGLYFGVGMSSLSLIIVLEIGWRHTYQIIAGLSALSSLQVLTLKEPIRGRYDNLKQ